MSLRRSATRVQKATHNSGRCWCVLKRRQRGNVSKATKPSAGQLVPQQRSGSDTEQIGATTQSRDVSPASNPVEEPVVVRREDSPEPSALAEWDRLVDTCPGTDVTQLSAWSRIRGLVGYRPTYLLAYRGNRLVGGALVLRRTLLRWIRIGYLPYGPLRAEGDSAPAAVSGAVVDELVALAGELTMMFVQPPEGATDVTDALLARGFRVSTAGIAPAGSYRVDLTPPIAEIRARFSKRLKSWTNRWESHGVTVRRGDERDLPLLCELMAHTAARHHFDPPSLDYVTTLYRELAAGEHAALFIGQVHNKPVCADVVTVVADMVRGRLGGFDGSGEASKLSVPAAVRWEILRWAKEHGHRWLDFGGLPEQMLYDMIDRGIHASDEWPSAQRAKLAFNGTAFRYPTPVELIRPAVVRTGYDFATRHRIGQRALALARNTLRGNRTAYHSGPRQAME